MEKIEDVLEIVAAEKSPANLEMEELEALKEDLSEYKEVRIASNLYICRHLSTPGHLITGWVDTVARLQLQPSVTLGNGQTVDGLG